MFSRIKKIYLFLISLILFVLIFQSQIKTSLQSIVSPELYQRVSFIKKLALNQDFGFYKWEEVLEKNNLNIIDFIYQQNFSFSIQSEIKKIGEKETSVYKLPPIFPAVGHNELNGSYIDFYEDNIIYATKNGIFFNIEKDEMNMTFKPVKSNISEFFVRIKKEKNASINYFNPYTISKFGVKDILVDNKSIYVSYIEHIDNKGYNTSILHSLISDSLVFKKLFSSKNYINANNKEFYPIQSGGRIVNFGKDSLLFSIGEYRDRLKAQDINSDNGKILSINKYNGESRIVSMGHRNSQGLDYSPLNKYIISTDMGPSSGDEINFHSNTDIVQNFGWPISSYGYHYDLKNSMTDMHTADKKRVIKGAPLYKSHSEYGFAEPIKYFLKNPAVSEIRFINHDYNFPEFILSTLGYDTIQRPMARHLLHYKYDIANDSIQLITKYSVNERIRDLAFDKKLNKIYYVGESTGVIGELSLD